MRGLNIAFFGSSLVSTYWNGAATYYRGMIRALHERGHRVTFYEPDAGGRQQHRDMDDPDWARVVVYWAESEADILCVLENARDADLVIKASGVGVFDELLEEAVLTLQGPSTTVVFWDMDAPATLDRMRKNADDPFCRLVSRYDLVLTGGGGDAVVRGYQAFGAAQCVPIHGALDTHSHHPAPRDPRFTGDLGFLGNRLPDRESRVDEFYFQVARKLAGRRFLLGGSGWENKPKLKNVRRLGHVQTCDHNAFNSTVMAVLNVNRESRARCGFSPPTRVFEAAGAEACLITDEWEGIELFLEPGREVFVAHNGDDVADYLRGLTPNLARQVGCAARRRVLARDTYAHRAEAVENVLEGKTALA